MAQTLIKTVWQRASLRRRRTAQMRPVFLWADEAHLFATAEDLAFFTNSRDARICGCYITQNLSNYDNAFATRGGKSATQCLIGSFGTKIFHANADVETNRFAQDLIGVRTVRRHSGGVSHAGGATNSGWSESTEPLVPAHTFTTLAKGGPEGGLLTEAVIVQTGRTWKATGENFLKVIFDQRLPV
jgi:type IV secretory pathway TraG/TraD family ATPase VirD4